MKPFTAKLRELLTSARVLLSGSHLKSAQFSTATAPIVATMLTCGLSFINHTSQPHHQQVKTVFPAFREHTIATDLTAGYQVVVSDINHDGKPDLIALASGLNELIWFENPGWQRHVIVSGISRPINCAAWDIDGDGIPEIALAYEFSNEPSRSIGIVSILEHQVDPRQQWKITEIDRLSTSHRLRWVDIGKGKKVLVNAPLAGASAKAPDYKAAVPLVFYRPGVWKRELISDEVQGVLHGILPAHWSSKEREDILTASFLGIDLFTMEQDNRWHRTRLANGNADPWPKGGSSEIAVGRLAKERFFCSIEPWHGNQVVLYRQQAQGWHREAIDTSLNDGHVLLTAELNQDGRDEIIAGYRGPGRSVYIYSAQDDGRQWIRQKLDDGGISAAGCAVADLNGDGKLDVVCIGSATSNLKWYENIGQVIPKK
jgi:FG-GAP-like repeat/Aldos-2-ulose dehydratase, beta-propeller domain